MILYRTTAGNKKLEVQKKKKKKKLEVQLNDKQVMKSVLNKTEEHNQASKMTK